MGIASQFLKRCEATFVLVTDDLTSYKGMADKLGLTHQVCQLHVRCWVERTLHELRKSLPEAWQATLAEVKTLLAELSPEGSRRLFELWKPVPERRAGRGQEPSPLGQLRYLLIHLSEHWESYPNSRQRLKHFSINKHNIADV